MKGSIHFHTGFLEIQELEASHSLKFCMSDCSSWILFLTIPDWLTQKHILQLVLLSSINLFHVGPYWPGVVSLDMRLHSIKTMVPRNPGSNQGLLL